MAGSLRVLHLLGLWNSPRETHIILVQLTKVWTVLETLIPRICLIPSQAEEHVQWVLQRAVTFPALYFAITATGATGFRAHTRSSFRPYPDRFISQYEAVLTETIAIKHLRLSLDTGQPFDSVVLIYVITCLMITKVQSLFLDSWKTLTKGKIFNGNKSAIQVHASALSSLIRTQEAQIAIPVHVMEMFVS